MIRWVALIATLGLATCTGACGASHHVLPAQTVPSPRARLSHPPAHIAVVVMENEEYGDIVGSHATPYITHLAHAYGLARSSYAITHPSLPNYLALTGGSTFGITSDCTDCTVPGAGLAGQLSAGGTSWKAYMEDLPHPCFGGSGSGDYAKKHNPFAYYRALQANGACHSVVPLSALKADELASRLPHFIWITPNLCHDMHDCDPATGDRFLRTLIPPLLSALGNRGLVILTWDEGSSDDGCCRLASGGHVATIVAGGLARRGMRFSTPVDHYSVLQLVEDLFDLQRLGGANCVCTPSLRPMLRG